jgi:DNA-binding transcriptional ArsR family regulator
MAVDSTPAESIWLQSYMIARAAVAQPKEMLLDEIAEWLKAMADPTRLRILHAMQNGEKCVTDLLEGMECSQANVSKHLAILRKAGLVDCRREGSSVYYRIADQAVYEICGTVCDSLQHQLAGRQAGLARGRAEFQSKGRGKAR